VVEPSDEDRLHRLLQLNYPDLADHLIPLRYPSGVPLTATWLVEQIITQEKK
jgi:hypothetical protein